MGLTIRILLKLGLVCAHCYYHNYTNPKFEARRQEWLDNSTPDSILADFTSHLYNDSGGVVVTGLKEHKKALKALKKAFASHANSENCWDLKSFESYFKKRFPQDEKIQAVLVESMPSLWKLVAFFAQWPFVTTLRTTPRSTGLDFPGFVRAITFLCGKHESIFFDEDNQLDLGTKRTDRLMVEYIFRGLATPQIAEKQPSENTPHLGETAKSSHTRDVIDIVYMSQPLYNEHTCRKGIDFVAPLANRLSDPEPPALSTTCIKVAEYLLPLVDLFIPLLQHLVNKFNETGCENLIEYFERAREGLLNRSELSFEAFMDLFAGEYVYDSVALIFSTFLHADCLTDGSCLLTTLGRERLCIYLACDASSLQRFCVS